LGDSIPPRSYKVYLSIYSISTGSVTDVTAKLVTSDVDVITGIEIDKSMNQLWIATNNNSLNSDCYTLDLSLVKRYSNVNVISNSDPQRQYIVNRELALTQYNNMVGDSSIMAMDFDNEQAIVEIFKEGIYIFSYRDNKKTTIGMMGNASVLLTKKRAFAGGSYELITVKRDTLSVKKFRTRREGRIMKMDYNEHIKGKIAALAASETRLFIGTANGLFFANVSAFD